MIYPFTDLIVKLLFLVTLCYTISNYNQVQTGDKNMNKILKDHIETYFQQEDYPSVLQLLTEYSSQCSNDRDLWFYECAYFLSTSDYSKALKIAQKCTRKFPTSYESYYYQASAYQAQGMILEALKSYKTSLFFLEYFKIDAYKLNDDIQKQISELETYLESMTDAAIRANDTTNLIDLSSYFERQKNIWGKWEKSPRDDTSLIVGNEYWVSDTDLRYIGIYRSPVQCFIGKENLSLIRTRGEFLNFCQRGTEVSITAPASTYLLPIASKQSNTIHSFQTAEGTHTIMQVDPLHFNYYRLTGNALIHSDHRAYYGYPIPLVHEKKRKKLILSFFLDGLAQEVINGTDFKKLMPNTYHFFKKGTICTHAYSCSEWTFPSLATYESGLNTLNHMMFHNTIDGELPTDTPTLSEYIKRKGYYTSKFDGDWRCIYSYGFARGIDQYVYQIQSMGARAEQEVINIIEHLEAFKETDQYLWMSVGDLHDIADGLDLSVAVQKNLSLKDREYEDKGVTSVKQNYSSIKIQAYKENIHYLDMIFGFLYSYIENNYQDDDMIVSLFADHGQGYLVPPGKHFLSKERTNVAFMFRGANIKPIVSDEIISTADYLPIMCKLADIKLDNIPIDGQLPKIFGGEKERSYTITESLHPGDIYSAVANAKDYEIYFDNSEKTDDEGRFLLGDYKVYGYYKNGDSITDKDLLNRFSEIFLSRLEEHIIYQ